jgi:hypothetical protein
VRTGSPTGFDPEIVDLKWLSEEVATLARRWSRNDLRLENL